MTLKIIRRRCPVDRRILCINCIYIFMLYLGLQKKIRYRTIVLPNTQKQGQASPCAIYSNPYSFSSYPYLNCQPSSEDLGFRKIGRDV